MNMRIDPNIGQEPLLRPPKMRSDLEPDENSEAQAHKPSWFHRAFFGGSLNDVSRLPRYFGIAALSLAALWAPVVIYLTTAPLRFTSDVTLILPGAGASSSVNLSEIGQASSSSRSAYSNSAVSPTVTYKRLLGANRVLKDAAQRSNVPPATLGKPRIRLIDETSLIRVEMTGATPEKAQNHAAALLTSFMAELDRLRADEIRHRAASVRAPIAEYEKSVKKIRAKISDLQARSGLISTEHYNQLVSDVAKLEAHIRDTSARLDQARDEVTALEKALSVGPKTAGLTLRLHADTEFQELSAAVAAHSAELAAARGKYGKRHPDVVAARKAYQGARSRLYARAEKVTGIGRKDLDARVDMSPTGERGRLLAELVRAHARQKGLAGEQAVLIAGLLKRREEANRLMTAAAELDDLNRDYQVAEAVFTSALARTDTTKSDVYASYPLVQVLEDASLPTEPTSPKRKLAILGGVAASFLLLVALVLAWIRRPLLSRLIHSESKT